jgi:hypothetical protein
MIETATGARTRGALTHSAASTTSHTVFD